MNLFNNMFTDYKSLLLSSQEENKRITNELNEYKTKLQESYDKNKQLMNEWKDYQLEKDEIDANRSLIKVLHDENKVLKQELKELRRAFITIKREMGINK